MQKIRLGVLYGGPSVEHEIAVISVEEPYGNANIIGKEGITLHDYVKDALYV